MRRQSPKRPQQFNNGVEHAGKEKAKKRKKKKSPNSVQKCCASLLLTLKPCARQTPTSPAKAKSKVTPASHYRKTDFAT